MRATTPWGSGASQLQVQRAVEQFFRDNPPKTGVASGAQVAAAVADYLSRFPPTPGKDGTDATDAQVQTTVNTYFAAHPPASGKDATDAQVAAATAAYLAANPPAKGERGPPGGVLLRQITVTDTAAVAITLGIVELQFACAGAVVGERYEAYVRSSRINGGTSSAGRPSGYWIVSADCRAADTITVAHMRPALALGGKYELLTDIVRVIAA